MSSRVVQVGWAACVGLGLMLLSGLACQPAEPRIYTVRGVVKQLLAEQNRVEIEHEEIPGFMPAMTMEFEVRDPGLLRGLSPEEPIRFRLEHHADSLYLIAVERLAGADPPDVRHGSEERPAVAAPERLDAQPDPESVAFTPFPAPDFLLTDQDAQPFGLSSLRGKAILLDFIFTQCPGPCPMLSTKFSHVQRRLGERLGSQVMLVSVTIDPRRDTPEVLKAYAERYRADLSGWKFLTGAPHEILLVATEYGAEYRGGSAGIVDHRLLTYVIDRDGLVVRVFDGVNHTVEELLAALEQVLAASRSPHSSSKLIASASASSNTSSR